MRRRPGTRALERRPEDWRLLRQRTRKRGGARPRPHRGGAGRDRRDQDQGGPGATFRRFFKLNLINPMIGYVDGDAQQPDHDILYVFRAGLGLPDRDYYLKDDEAEGVSREVRRVPRPHLKLAGQPNAGADGPRDLRARDAAGASPLDQRREPRRGQDLQQGGARAICQAVPGFDWTAPGPPELGVAERHRGRRQSTKLLQGVRRCGQRAAGRSLEAVSAGVTR